MYFTLLYCKVNSLSYQLLVDKPLGDVPLALVGHVLGVLGLDLVDDDLVGQLHGQPALEHGQLLDQVLALDAHLDLGEQVLHDHVRHVLAVGVALLVQAVHRADHHLVHADRAVLAADGLRMQEKRR